MQIIAHMHSDFPDKFGIPHQGGWIPQLQSRIVFEKEYRDSQAFRGLEEFSHIWILWEFSGTADKGWSPTVRPPRLGGNTRKGVFATRSPFRPNPIGLSVVKLEKIEFHKELGPVLHVAGADLMDGTPIYDIKPYLPYIDSIPDASGGFTSAIQKESLQVEFPENWLNMVPEEKREALLAVLADDPRPGYQKDPDRIYGMPFGNLDVRFSVAGRVLRVCEVITRE